MNKKGLSAVVGTILIIFLVIVAVLIIWLVARGIFNPELHTKITKEECWNETTYLYKYKCDNGEIILSERKVPLIYKSSERCLLINEFEPSNSIIEEICKQVEANKIVIEKESCINCSKENTTCYNMPENYSACVGYLKIIYSKDISREWLNENCECEEGEYYCKTGKLTKNCFGGTVNCCYVLLSENRLSADYKCSKYKCEFDETYFIETWSQLK